MSDFRKDVEEMSARLAQLGETLDQFAATMREVQATVTFGAHPDLTELDDELDIIYRGQL
jgi:hypothetical protein